MKTRNQLGLGVALLALTGCGAEVPDRAGNFVIVHDNGAAPRCELLVRSDGAPDVRIEASSCKEEGINGHKVAMNAGACGRLEFIRASPGVLGGPHFCASCSQLGPGIRVDGCPLAYKNLDRWERVVL